MTLKHYVCEGKYNEPQSVSLFLFIILFLFFLFNQLPRINFLIDN